jgi:anti-sigma28 factor (negative regulator of flagellin synthesis)
MEIKPTNINNIARLYQKTTNNQPKSEESTRAVRQDVVEISKEGASRSEFESVVRMAATEVSKSMSTKELNELRQRIESGEYSVSARDIAWAILSRISNLNGEDNE